MDINPKSPNHTNDTVVAAVNSEDFFWLSEDQLYEILIDKEKKPWYTYTVEEAYTEEYRWESYVIKRKKYDYPIKTPLQKKYIHTKLFLKNLTITWIKRHICDLFKRKRKEEEKPTIDFMYWMEGYEQLKTKIFNVLWQYQLPSLQKAQLDTAFITASGVHWLTLRKNWEQYIKHILFIANAFIEQTSSTKLTSDPQKLVDYLTLVFLHDVWEDGINRYFYKLVHTKDKYWNVIISWWEKDRDIDTLLWPDFRLSNISYKGLQKIMKSFWNDSLIGSLSLLTKRDTLDFYKDTYWWDALYKEYCARTISDSSIENYDSILSEENKKEYKLLSYYWNLFNRWDKLSEEHIMAIRVKLLDKYHNCVSTRWWWVDPDKWYEWAQEARLLLHLIDQTWTKALFHREYNTLEAVFRNLHTYIADETWISKHKRHNKTFKKFSEAIWRWKYRVSSEKLV